MPNGVGRGWFRQRIRALNAFLADVYGEQRILKDGVPPPNLILNSPSYLEACRGLRPPRGVWCHITGTDLVRGQHGQIYVPEDNLRCPYILYGEDIFVLPGGLTRVALRRGSL
ncbi:MAG: circularly permuted type 2 ATP-grasp protein, partial [Chloracidobacterium sp.]|nr:circularly permuted type 2 ATP-grasp protein [Chloracidobacterium sp.]